MRLDRSSWRIAALALVLATLIRCGSDDAAPTAVDDSGALGLAGTKRPGGNTENLRFGPGTDPANAVPATDGTTQAVPPGDGLLTFEGSGVGCFGAFPTTFYAGLGVDVLDALLGFETSPPGLCYNEFVFPARSAVSLVTASDPFAVFGPTITLNFGSAKDRVGAHVSNSLGGISLTCYSGLNGSGAIVGSDSYGDTGCLIFCTNPANRELRVDAAGILSCEITGLTGFFAADDVFFHPAGLAGPGTCEGFPTSPGVTSFTFDGVTTFIGTDFPDVIGGTNHSDVVLGKGEEDQICTYDGIDTIDGGGGDDRIFAGNQDDFVFGKQGSDYIEGGNADDRIDGGHTPVPSSSPDTDPDTCVGGNGADRFYLCETIIDSGKS